MDGLSPQDLTDDRLGDVLRLLFHDGHWQAFEQELMGHVLRVFDLPATCVRIDTTTAGSYAEVNEQGLLQLGRSKDHRPALPQLKLVLASLDPLGLPLATEVLSGEHADDPFLCPSLPVCVTASTSLDCSLWKVAKWPTCRPVRSKTRMGIFTCILFRLCKHFQNRYVRKWKLNADKAVA